VERASGYDLRVHFSSEYFSSHDTCAREEWGWDPKYDLAMTTRDMLTALKKRKEKRTF
jgi:hypothetical protein